MFLAALTSRSWAAPQEQIHDRTFSGIFSVMVAHCEQTFEDGYQRSITTRSRPYQAAL